MRIQNLPPMEIERESFRIITAELGDRPLDPEQAPIIKRVIHTTADFEYTETLYFSPGWREAADRALAGERPVGGAVFFMRTYLHSQGTIIGAHCFWGSM